MTKQSSRSRVVILRGLSGAGKTRWAAEQRRQHGAVDVSADHYFEDAQGGYKFVPERIAEVHEDCFRDFLWYLRQQHPYLIVDNTNVERWQWSPYDLAARAHGYTVETRVFLTCVSVALLRGQHDVPLDVLRKWVTLAPELTSCRPGECPACWPTKPVEVSDVDRTKR